MPQKAGAEESGWFSYEPYAHLEAVLTVCGTGEVLSADPRDQSLVFALVEALLNAPSYLFAVSGKGLTWEGWFDAHESLFEGNRGRRHLSAHSGYRERPEACIVDPLHRLSPLVSGASVLGN